MIRSLTHQESHVPYRDSKLTYLLRVALARFSYRSGFSRRKLSHRDHRDGLSGRFCGAGNALDASLRDGREDDQKHGGGERSSLRKRRGAAAGNREAPARAAAVPIVACCVGFAWVFCVFAARIGAVQSDVLGIVLPSRVAGSRAKWMERQRGTTAERAANEGGSDGEKDGWRGGAGRLCEESEEHGADAASAEFGWKHGERCEGNAK